MLILAAIEHRIRTLLAAIDCGMAERARGFDSYEAGDFLDTTERARQVLVERETEEEVAEPLLNACPSCGWTGVTSAAYFNHLVDDCPATGASQVSAHAGADPSPTIVQSAPQPSVRDEGPSEQIAPFPRRHSEGLPTSPIDVAAEAAIEMFDFFVERYALPELRAHFADNDDNAAENVRRRIRAVALVAATANARRAADMRITQRLNDAGFKQGRDYEPPFHP